MIVKKLRAKKSWSQDQLATLAGVSLRTIQRVEAGNTASLETLKSLASVFEIEISRLTEEIVVINKATEEWKNVPRWVSIGVWGMKSRKAALMWERLCVLIGTIGFVWGFVDPIVMPLTAIWAAAYWYAVSIRWIDKEQLWR
jgi:transcriptional regulator with XRE-family HTH domain